MPTPITTPTEAELKAVLGAAFTLWTAIIRTVEDAHAPLDQLWKPSKSAFGRVCTLQYKKRTLLYLSPETKQIQAAIVLGERAYELAMNSALPADIKTLFSEARPYAEGRGIRFAVSSPKDLPVVSLLVEIKTTPP